MMTLKLATTLDGQDAAADGTSQWITGPEAGDRRPQTPSRHDAVLVGSRHCSHRRPVAHGAAGDWTWPQPRPVVIVGRRDLPDQTAICRARPRDLRSQTASTFATWLRTCRITASCRSWSRVGHPSPQVLLDAGLVDELVWYFGAKVAGGIGMPAFADHFATLGDATEVTVQDVTRIGSDIRVLASVGRNSKE